MNNDILYFKTTKIYEEWQKSTSIKKNNVFNTLRRIVVPSNVKRIEDYAFHNCELLKEVIFEENSQLEFIGEHAFCKSGIEYVKIPANVEYIEDYAFWSCQNLREVIFEDNGRLETIQKEVFGYCRNLNSIIFGTGSKVKKIKNGAFFDHRSDKITLPQSLVVIESLAFTSEYLKEIIFDDNCKVETINGFSNCFRIEKIAIPNSILNIEKFAFNGCYSLSQVTFEKNSKLKIIGSNAFSNTLLSRIILPKSLESISGNSFHGERFIQYDTEDSCERYTVIDGILYNNDVTEIVSVPTKKDMKNFIFPNKVVSIGQGAFYNNEINKITIPSSICHIGSEAFKSCEKLVKVHFEKNAKLLSIEEEAFKYSGLVEIEIPKSVKHIKKAVFQSCEKLTKIIFEKVSIVETIGSSAFTDCGYQSIVIPSSVKYIGYYAFFPKTLGCTIYCEHLKKPVDWDDDWMNTWNEKYKHTVVWGFK